MPVATLVRYALTTTVEKISISYRLRVTNAANDFIGYALTIVNPLLLGSAPFRILGFRPSLDKGAGTLETLKGGELGADVGVSGSLDGFGVRELTLRWFGKTRIPFKAAALRAMKRITLDLVRGVPGSIGSRPLFDGYLRDSSFTAGTPPVASITAQDASLPHSLKPMFYNLAPGGELTRNEIAQLVCEEHEIPFGNFDVPNGGGAIRKPISEGGDRTVLEWMKLFYEPVGARPYWRHGELCVKKFDTSGDAVRTLGGGDFRSLTINPPSSNAPNQVQLSAAVFEYEGPTNTRTITDTQSFRATYAIKKANVRQNTDGSIDTLSLTSTPADREVRRLVTRTTYTGGNITRRVIEEWGWYIPKACNRKTSDGGATTTHNTSFAVYQFADGSWRTGQEETFRIIRTTDLTRSFNTDEVGLLTGEVETIEQYHATQIRLGYIDDGTCIDTWDSNVLITEDGIAWQNGMEELATETNTTTFQLGGLNIGGKITAIRVPYESVEWSAECPPLPIYDSGGASVGYAVDIFGPSAAYRYGIAIDFGLLGDTLGGPYDYATVTVQNARVDEDSHNQTTTFQYRAPRHINTSFQTVPVTGTVLVPGPVPTIEQATWKQQAQSATVTLTDTVRVGLAGDVTLPDQRSNDFCETRREMRTAALEILREYAPTVDIEMAVDGVIEEGSVIAVDHPDLGYGPVKLLVWNSSWNIGADGTNSQQLSCRWYTPELEDAA
jgi:hypothetical protein